MATVFDVGAFVLMQIGPATPTELHKLIYYAQGHLLAWEGVPLFDEVLEAWANGPVCHELWRGQPNFSILAHQDIPGDSTALTGDQRGSIIAVLDAYGHLDCHQLSVMTQAERPWREARGSLPPGQRHNQPLDLSVMRQHFADLIALDQVGDDSNDQ